MSASSILENIRRDIRQRSDTDRMLSTAWVLLPVISIISTIVLSIAAVAAFFAGFIAMGGFPTDGEIPTDIGLGFVPLFAGFVIMGVVAFVFGILLLYLIYLLIKRRNDHFRRQWNFTTDTVSLINALAKDKNVDIESRTISVERTLRDMRADEGEKSAVLWIILGLVFPPALLYVWYFLGKDFYRHERREDGVWEDISKAVEKLDVPVTLRRGKPMPDRSFVLYLVLSIVTVGLFGIYWLYVLIDDPNKHFRDHIHFEDDLLAALSGVA